MGNAWNREFRDMSAVANYPFTANSSLAYKDSFLDQGFILDMMVYPVEARVMPYHMAAIRGGSGEKDEVKDCIEIIIKDVNYDTVCIFTLLSRSDAVPGLDTYGRTVGIVTYDRVKLPEVQGKVGTGELNFERADAEICAGCSFQVPVKGTLGIKSQSGIMLTDRVLITAANGLTFTLLPGGTGIDVELSMYGEMRTIAMPVKTINHKAYDHYWLAAHPDSAVRVVTKPADKAVTVGVARNFTYDDQTRNS